MASDRRARGSAASCCPLPAGIAPLAVPPGVDDETNRERLARWAHALSDPIRLRMLEVMIAARECCRPAEAGPDGVCVCELQSLQGLAQSKVSYHLKVLRDAGLVREQRRGKWTFYAVDEAAAAEFTAAVRRQLGL
jgi:ArsR family transcriptional regulator